MHILPICIFMTCSALRTPFLSIPIYNFILYILFILLHDPKCATLHPNKMLPPMHQQSRSALRLSRDNPVFVREVASDFLDQNISDLYVSRNFGELWDGDSCDTLSILAIDYTTESLPLKCDATPNSAVEAIFGHKSQAPLSALCGSMVDLKLKHPGSYVSWGSHRACLLRVLDPFGTRFVR